MDEVVQKIAGEITLSDNPGASLKKWREMFGVTQTELAEHMGVTPSTISDYESNRRKSPGIKLIRRFIEALCKIDEKRGGWTLKNFTPNEKKKDIYTIHELKKPLSGFEFIEMINGKALTNKRKLKTNRIYAVTFVDSLRAILELPADEFVKIYGSTTERALIFTNVSMGRSPMVAIRVTKLKPSLVVLHNITEVDPLAIKISEIEGVPIATSLLPLSEIKSKVIKT